MNPDDLAAFRLVAVDGCDGTGKTSLATLLATRHGFTVVHSPRTPDHLDLTDRYRDLIDGAGRVVMDRCFVSELVYGPIRRGRTRLSLAEAVDLAEAVTQRGGVLVHLTAPPHVVRRRLIDRDGPPPTPMAEISHLLDAYQQIFAAVAVHVPVITIDTAQATEPFR